MTRLVAWWSGLAVSAVLVVAALADGSGTCVDAPDPAASSCATTGSGGLLVVALATTGLSLWMLRRARRARRR